MHTNQWRTVDFLIWKMTKEKKINSQCVAKHLTFDGFIYWLNGIPLNGWNDIAHYVHFIKWNEMLFWSVLIFRFYRFTFAANMYSLHIQFMVHVWWWWLKLHADVSVNTGAGLQKDFVQKKRAKFEIAPVFNQSDTAEESHNVNRYHRWGDQNVPAVPKQFLIEKFHLNGLNGFRMYTNFNLANMLKEIALE